MTLGLIASLNRPRIAYRNLHLQRACVVPALVLHLSREQLCEARDELLQAF